jgi:hypothetical protein
MGTTAVVIAVALVTSAAAYALGTRALHRSPRRLRAAVSATLELIGVSALFFVVNVVVGALAIGAVRGLTSTFVSIYHVSDVSLLVLSLVQGLLFAGWKE